jgi:hypothetical protein
VRHGLFLTTGNSGLLLNTDLQTDILQYNLTTSGSHYEQTVVLSTVKADERLFYKSLYENATFRSEYVFGKYVPYWEHKKEPLIEDMMNMTTTRPLNDNELAGNNILIAIKTTRKYHSKRLPPILDTWLTTANGSNIFIITDGSDPKYQDICQKLGINYVISKNYGNGFKANQCYKTGVELGLMDKHENQHYDWFCNVDDDMYVNMKSLINFLAKFDTSSDVTALCIAYQGHYLRRLNHL